jgi:hypothetical protein
VEEEITKKIMNSLTSSKPTIQSNQTGLRGGLAALVAASLLAAGPAFAGDPQGTPPSVAELLHQVETTVRTPKGYSAAIHQQVTRPSVAGARVAGTVEIMAEEDYALDCNEAGEARHVRKVSAAVAAVKRAEAKPGEPPVVRGGLMTVNPLKALEHVAALPATGVVEEDSAGVPCYKISAVDNRRSGGSSSRSRARRCWTPRSPTNPGGARWSPPMWRSPAPPMASR